jgi:hypothetical protein
LEQAFDRLDTRAGGKRSEPMRRLVQEAGGMMALEAAALGLRGDKPSGAGGICRPIS